MRADPDGEDYLLNGSKTWTTHAHHANWIFCLVRTAREGKPQAGISFLLVSMDSPGIEVRPILTTTGEHELNEVFFSDVRVPKSQRVGDEGQGWTIAKYLLEFERGSLIESAPLTRALQELVDLARSTPGDGCGTMWDDQATRRCIAELEGRVECLAYAELSALEGGDEPGSAANYLKLEAADLIQSVEEAAMQILGPGALRMKQGAPGAPSPSGERAAGYVTRYLNFRAASIYGGTAEIQRSLIARNLLG
jgi:acyl-CoA dehydrogenase